MVMVAHLIPRQVDITPSMVVAEVVGHILPYQTGEVRCMAQVAEVEAERPLGQVMVEPGASIQLAVVGLVVQQTLMVTMALHVLLAVATEVEVVLHRTLLEVMVVRQGAAAVEVLMAPVMMEGMAQEAR